MFTEQADEHKWLMRFLGEWTFENECDGGPDAETMKSTGTERVEAFGGLWVVGDGEGEAPGGDMMRMRMTLGYNPTKGKYVGSWICTVMGSMFVYEGTRDGDVLTLDTEGPSMADPSKTARYQDIIELHGDRRVLRSRAMGDDGEWTEFMRGEYSRKQ